MNKKEKAPKKSPLRNTKRQSAKKKELFPFFAILPQLLIIALCIGIYYAMINYYLFFSWGIYIYFAIKLVIAYEILLASTRSLSLPLAAMVFGLLILFTNNLYLTNLMSRNSAWELMAVALAGIVISLFLRKKR